MTAASDVGPGIVLSCLSKSYGAVHAVRGIDLVIAPGETVALLGPNGAGKTTTVEMMLGLTRPDRGTVSIFGVPPAAARQAGWFGAMLQTGSPLDHLRVREIVTLMASYYPHPLGVHDVLRLTGADTGEVENLGGWLTTVVARVSLNMLRSRRHRHEEPAGDSWPGAAEAAARAGAAGGPGGGGPAGAGGAGRCRLYL